MADFKIAYKRTSLNEGGYTDNPDDNGNWTGAVKGKGILIGTNKGISASVLAKYLGHTPSAGEMKMLTTETAQDIYKKNYWDIMRGDEWDNQENVNNVYDMCVNAGCSSAIKMWQRSIGVEATGKMDFLTIEKTNLVR